MKLKIIFLKMTWNEHNHWGESWTKTHSHVRQITQECDSTVSSLNFMHTTYLHTLTHDVNKNQRKWKCLDNDADTNLSNSKWITEFRKEWYVPDIYLNNNRSDVCECECVCGTRKILSVPNVFWVNFKILIKCNVVTANVFVKMIYIRLRVCAYQWRR